MFKEYLKIAFRNMKRHKGYTVVNILGLTIGMFCVSLYMLLILYEYSFDSFHKDADQIYRLYVEDHSENGIHNIYSAPYPLSKTLRDDFPEIECITSIFSTYSYIESNKKHFNERLVFYVDPYFFKLFNFPVKYGDQENLLSQTNSIVITDAFVKKYFPNENPLGKTFIIDNQQKVYVSGVIHIPENSYFFNRAFFLPHTSIDIMNKIVNEWRSNWEVFSFWTYIKLKKNVTPKQFEKKTSCLFKKPFPEKEFMLRLLKFKHLHLNNELFKSIKGNNNLLIFSIIAAFILIIACINFSNLTSARFEKRFQEFQLRKTSGAKRSQLINQFLIETILIIFISFFLALMLLEILLPIFNSIWMRQVSITLFNIKTIVGLLFIIFFTIIISSIYPVWFLKNFNPNYSLIKKKYISLSKNSLIRKFLIICQFTLTTLLIIGSLIIYSQIKFSQSRELGMEVRNIVCIDYEISNQQNQKNFKQIKNELLKYPGILGVTSGQELPFYSNAFSSNADWEGKKPGQEVYFGIWEVDEDFIKTFNLKIIKGRDFNSNNVSDKYNVIINEEAARQMDLKSPIGKKFETNETRKGEIIGVIQNFHIESMKQNIKPLVLTPNFFGRDIIFIKLQEGDHTEQMSHLKKVWNQYNSHLPYKPHFLMDTYKYTFRNERKFIKILAFFSILSILISCLGVLTLSYFTVERRTKEIGIRKALGSRVIKIVWLISREFLNWVIISVLFSWPIAYFIMNKWLNTYAYHTILSIWPFVLASALTLMITLMTVSYHAVRSAHANPVDSIRDE